MAKKLMLSVPVVGEKVKKGVNYINTPKGVAVAGAQVRRGRGRPPQRELGVFIAKSIEIIQTIGAGKREMYLVAVAVSDAAFVAHKEGERARIQDACRKIGDKAVRSKRTVYSKKLKELGLQYEWLVNAAQLPPGYGLLELLRVHSRENKRQRNSARNNSIRKSK
jgi:hypothetical protein